VDGSMTMGLNGNITLGPLGREGEHLIGTGFNGGLLVMSSAKGIYGGVSPEFSGFKASRRANVAHYGRSIDAAEILDSGPAPSGDAFARAYKAPSSPSRCSSGWRRAFLGRKLALHS
jgi:lipid-binding SYLF domain-containing protein